MDSDEENISQPIITRNGVRLWQSISAVAFAAAVGAIGWNFTQLQAINGSLSTLTERTSALNEMRSTDSRIQQAIAEIRARQGMNEHRLDVLEAINRGNK